MQVMLAKDYGIRPWEYHLVGTEFIKSIDIFNLVHPPEKDESQGYDE